MSIERELADCREKIESLRQEQIQTINALTKMSRKAKYLRRKNEILRAALEEIAKPTKYVTSDGYPSRPASMIAREALDK